MLLFTDETYSMASLKAVKSQIFGQEDVARNDTLRVIIQTKSAHELLHDQRENTNSNIARMPM